MSIVTIVISALGLIVALLAIWLQTRQSNLALGASILRDLEKQFHWSEEMRHMRLSLATFLLNRKPGELPSTEASNMLDFFDIVALYHNRKVIDTEMTWVTFYYWIAHYWQFLKNDADYYETLLGGVEYYKNLKLLYVRLTKFGEKSRKLPPYESYFSADNLKAFLIEEIRQCSNGQELGGDSQKEFIVTSPRAGRKRQSPSKNA